MNDKAEKYIQKLEQAGKGHEKDLTISGATRYAQEKWGISIKINALRTAITRKKLKATKIEDIGWYVINPKDFEDWLVQTNRINAPT